jgi:phosphate starvation-inducible PhoH-like protein
MSKKTRLRKSLADLEFGDNDIEAHTTAAPPNLGIRNKYQLNDVHKSFLDTCLYERTKMVLVDGPAGTAKTFLAVYAGLLLLQEKKIKNIIYIRSIVESATKSIGALPGELDEKFKPWSLPLLDKLNELLPPTSIDELMQSNTIKCIPVNFVRGLTFHDSMVIIDEFQNLTHEEGVTILTRFGHNSKYIAIGDARQADIGSKSGFKDLFNAFDDEESVEHGIHTFKFDENEIVRSKILRFIVSKIAKVKKPS